MTERLTDEALERGAGGSIRTARFETVRYWLGHETGDVFGHDCEYEGPTLTIEVADAADAQAMLDAISSREAADDDLRAAAIVALASVDAFMSGMPITDAQKAQSDALARAASFASEAYRQGYDHDQATHAMLRAFLTALVDPLHTDLDYLRADLAAGSAARAALSQNGGA